MNYRRVATLSRGYHAALAGILAIAVSQGSLAQKAAKKPPNPKSVTNKKALELPRLLNSGELLNRTYRVFDTARTIDAHLRITRYDIENGTEQTTTVYALIENRNDGSGYASRSRTELFLPDLRRLIVLKDGKSDYLLDPEKKEYERRPPSSDRFTDIFRILLDMFQTSGGQFKTTAPGPRDRTMIDQATYILVGKTSNVSMWVKLGGTPLTINHVAARRLQPDLMFTLTILDYSLNKNPPSDVFTVPKGYRLVPTETLKNPDLFAGLWALVR